MKENVKKRYALSLLIANVCSAPVEAFAERVDLCVVNVSAPAMMCYPAVTYVVFSDHQVIRAADYDEKRMAIDQVTSNTLNMNQMSLDGL